MELLLELMMYTQSTKKHDPNGFDLSSINRDHAMLVNTTLSNFKR